MDNKDIDISSLLDKFAFQLTGRDLCNLITVAIASTTISPEASVKLCNGIRALAQQLGCCESTIYMLKREGVLDEAIKSQVGKKIVFDVEKARVAADKFQKDRRQQMSNESPIENRTVLFMPIKYIK